MTKLHQFKHFVCAYNGNAAFSTDSLHARIHLLEVLNEELEEKNAKLQEKLDVFTRQFAEIEQTNHEQVLEIERLKVFTSTLLAVLQQDNLSVMDKYSAVEKLKFEQAKAEIESEHLNHIKYLETKYENDFLKISDNFKQKYSSKMENKEKARSNETHMEDHGQMSSHLENVVFQASQTHNCNGNVVFNENKSNQVCRDERGPQRKYETCSIGKYDDNDFNMVISKDTKFVNESSSNADRLCAILSEKRETIKEHLSQLKKEKDMLKVRYSDFTRECCTSQQQQSRIFSSKIKQFFHQTMRSLNTNIQNLKKIEKIINAQEMFANDSETKRGTSNASTSYSSDTNSQDRSSLIDDGHQDDMEKNDSVELMESLSDDLILDYSSFIDKYLNNHYQVQQYQSNFWLDGMNGIPALGWRKFFQHDSSSRMDFSSSLYYNNENIDHYPKTSYDSHLLKSGISSNDGSAYHLCHGKSAFRKWNDLYHQTPYRSQVPTYASGIKSEGKTICYQDSRRLTRRYRRVKEYNEKYGRSNCIDRELTKSP